MTGRSGEDDRPVARRLRQRWLEEGCSFRQGSTRTGLPDTARFDR